MSRQRFLVLLLTALLAFNCVLSHKVALDEDEVVGDQP